MIVDKKGFSLIEAIMSVALIAIFAAICLPRLNYAIISKHMADTTAMKISTDIRRTRSLAIANAATNTSGFELKMIGSAPYSSYQLVDLSDNSVVDTITIDQKVNCSGVSSFRFGPLGNLTSAGTSLTVSSQGKSFAIEIISGTGMVKCRED